MIISCTQTLAVCKHLCLFSHEPFPMCWSLLLWTLRRAHSLAQIRSWRDRVERGDIIGCREPYLPSGDRSCGKKQRMLTSRTAASQNSASAPFFAALSNTEANLVDKIVPRAALSDINTFSPPIFQPREAGKLVLVASVVPHGVDRSQNWREIPFSGSSFLNLHR